MDIFYLLPGYGKVLLVVGATAFLYFCLTGLARIINSNESDNKTGGNKEK